MSYLTRLPVNLNMSHSFYLILADVTSDMHTRYSRDKREHGDIFHNYLVNKFNALHTSYFSGHTQLSEKNCVKHISCILVFVLR